MIAYFRYSRCLHAPAWVPCCFHVRVVPLSVAVHVHVLFCPLHQMIVFSDSKCQVCFSHVVFMNEGDTGLTEEIRTVYPLEILSKSQSMGKERKAHKCIKLYLQ